MRSERISLGYLRTELLICWGSRPEGFSAPCIDCNRLCHGTTGFRNFRFPWTTFRLKVMPVYSLSDFGNCCKFTRLLAGPPAQGQGEGGLPQEERTGCRWVKLGLRARRAGDAPSSRPSVLIPYVISFPSYNKSILTRHGYLNENAE